MTDTQPSEDDFWSKLGAKAAPEPTAAEPAHQDEAFWSSLGSRDAASAAPAAPAGPPVAGIGNSVLRGIHEATDIPAAALGRVVDYGASKLGYQTSFGPDATAAAQPFNQAYDANPDNKGIGPAVGRFAGNALITVPASLGAGRILEGGLAAASNVVPAAANAIRFAAPAASGAVQGATVAGMTGEPLGPSTVVGGALGAAGGAIGAGINKLIGKASPEVEAAMNKYDIPLRAGQTTDNAFLRKVDQMTGQLPFSGRAAENEVQKQAVNRAIGQTFGEDVTKITPPVMARAQDRIGAVMNRIENTNTVKISDDAVNRLASIETNAQGSMEAGEFNVIKRQLDSVLSKVGPDGTIAGTTYGDLIGHGSPLDAATKSQNSNVAGYAKQIKSTLQDALHASLSPEDAAAYGQARYQYKNLMTVAPLVNKGTAGDISPLLLQGAANRSFKDAWRYGAGDLGEISDLAQRYLRAPADSGTPLGNAILGGFWQPVVAGGRLVAGATVGKAGSIMAGANPLTGVAAGPLVRGALPASVIIRNRLLQQQDGGGASVLTPGG